MDRKDHWDINSCKITRFNAGIMSWGASSERAAPVNLIVALPLGRTAAWPVPEALTRRVDANDPAHWADQSAFLCRKQYRTLTMKR